MIMTMILISKHGVPVDILLEEFQFPPIFHETPPKTREKLKLIHQDLRYICKIKVYLFIYLFRRYVVQGTMCGISSISGVQMMKFRLTTT